MKYENFRKEMIAVFNENHQGAVQVMSVVAAMVNFDDPMGDDFNDYRFYHEIKTDGSKIDLLVYGELFGEEIFSIKFNVAR